MRPEPGPLARRPGSAPRIRVTWLESTIPVEAPPPAVQEAPAGPGWAPYLLGGLAGALLLLATVGWPWWQPVGLWLEAVFTGTAPRP